ncbi:hypothetical protein ACFV2X_41170 [Streptomyces sp. NPDC059679]|uniref:hypothetical protein n=1 Tax=Streptomyces sp. NPDC059679 TaxID=3346903 RepID=UPI0036C353F5
MLEHAGTVAERGVLEQEVLLVLGPWLHSLGTGRPHITWAYTLGADEDHDDQVVSFSVPLPPLGDGPAKAPDALAEAGARTVLIEDRSNETARLLADAVDRVIIDIPGTPPSFGPTAAGGQGAESIPGGLQLLNLIE